MSLRNSGFPSRKRAFTLIEVLVVVALLGILASVVLFNLSDARESSKIAKAETELKAIEAAFKLYREITGTMPPGEDNCSLCGFGGFANSINVEVQATWETAVVSSVSARTSARLPARDPWGTHYAYDNNYRVTGYELSSVVCSLGPDRILQTWVTMGQVISAQHQARGDDICVFFREADDSNCPFCP